MDTANRSRERQGGEVLNLQVGDREPAGEGTLSAEWGLSLTRVEAALYRRGGRKRPAGGTRGRPGGVKRFSSWGRSGLEFRPTSS